MNQNQSELIVVDKKDKTFDIVVSAVNKLVSLAAPTYGPANNKVIIDKFLYRMVVDDGVQFARDFELPDPAENAVIRVLKEVAIKTSDRSKDGTTGSLLMVRAIINELNKKHRFSGHLVELELKKGFEDVKKHLEKNSIPIKTKSEMEKVARNSYNDPVVAKMISEVFSKIGKDGDVDVQMSPTMKTYYEISDGVKLNSGFISPYMVNNPEKMECVIEKPHFLITDYRLTETNDILPLMNKMVAAKKNNLVVIADNVEQKALATMVINLPHVMNPETKKLGTLMSVAVVAHSGDDRNMLLEDIAMLTGGKVFSSSKGDKLEKVEVQDLGTSDKFISRDVESIIIDPKGNKSQIASAVSSLRLAIENEPIIVKKTKLKKRLGLFTNSVATIKVGAPTDNERKAIIKKVENATYSVKAALSGGVVCGGGLELSRIKTSSKLLNEALKQPSLQLFENMDLDVDLDDIKKGEAINVITKSTGKFMDVGVCDPSDILISGVESAVSIASVLLTSSGMIVESAVKPPIE